MRAAGKEPNHLADEGGEILRSATGHQVAIDDHFLIDPLRASIAQIILDGQVPDSKTMSDVLQVVTMTLRTSPSLRGTAGAGGGGGGMAGGGMAGGGGGGVAGGAGGLVIINRVVVPGPRQVLLHVKIAELNRSATRDVGVSWLCP